MKDTILSKDTVSVTIGEDHSYNCTVVTLGRTGENAVSQLEITIPEELSGFWAYLDFKKPRGQTVKTPKLDIINNKIEYDIPAGLLNENGNLEVQLVLQSGAGEVWKSSVKKYVVLKSIDASEDIPEKKDFITEAQKILDKTEETLAKTQEVRDGDASAIKETVSGKAVSLVDISPLEHTMRVKARSKNLIPYPYKDTSKTINGITFTVNDDGTITANGTATATIYFILARDYILPVGKYFLSGNPSTYSISGILLYVSNSDSTFYKADTGNGVAIDNTIERNVLIGIAIPKDATVENLVFKPQLEIGTEATPHTPYVDVSTAKVNVCGKNLLSYPYAETTKSVNGIIYTDNGDGTITANGTATGQTNFFFANNETFSLPAGTYTFSVDCIRPNGVAVWLYKTSESKPIAYLPSTIQSITFTLAEKENFNAYILIPEGVSFSNVVLRPILNPGTTATEYESYKEPITYSVNADGTVEGVTSIYPTTTLIPDKEGAVLDVEYNVDTKKYIDKIYSQLASMLVNL